MTASTQPLIQEFCPVYRLPKTRKWYCRTLNCSIAAGSAELDDLDYPTLKLVYAELAAKMVELREAEDSDAKARKRFLKSLNIRLEGLLGRAKQRYNESRDARYECLRQVCVQYLEPELAQKLIRQADQRWPG